MHDLHGEIDRVELVFVRAHQLLLHHRLDGPSQSGDEGEKKSNDVELRICRQITQSKQSSDCCST